MTTTFSWADIRAKYPADQYIFVQPAVEMTMGHQNPMWRLDVAVVEIDPTNKSLVYAVDGAWDLAKSEKVALQRPALDLLAAAAELTVPPPEHKIVQRDPLVIEVIAAGIIRTPSGGVRGQGRTRKWDAALERDKVAAACEGYVDRAIDNRDNWAKSFTPETRAEKLAARIKKEWLREREFGPVKTESKAIGRVIRATLALESGYDPRELRTKKFAVPRWVFELDMNDPAMKMLAAQAGLAAQHQLAPPPMADPVAMLPAAPAEPVALPPADPAQNVTPPAASTPPPATVPADPPPPAGVVDDAELPDDIAGLSIALSKAVMAFRPAEGSDVTMEKLNRRWEKAAKANDTEDMKTLLAWLWSHAATMEGGSA